MPKSPAATMRALSFRVAALGAAALLSACASTSSGQTQDIRIAGERVFPESVTSDAAGNIYVGSLGGTIYRAPAGSAVAVPWVTPTERNGLLSLFGVLADQRHGLLWTCSNPNSFGPPDPTAGSSVVAFDLSSGTHRAGYPFPAGPAALRA